MRSSYLSSIQGSRFRCFQVRKQVCPQYVAGSHPLIEEHSVCGRLTKDTQCTRWPRLLAGPAIQASFSGNSEDNHLIETPLRPAHHAMPLSHSIGGRQDLASSKIWRSLFMYAQVRTVETPMMQARREWQLLQPGGLSSAVKHHQVSRGTTQNHTRLCPAIKASFSLLSG